MTSRFRQLSQWSFLGILWLLALAPLTQGQSTDPEPRKEREVQLTVSVTNDRGLPMKGLKPEHFKITSDKKPQQITTFSDRDEPISIAFLVDTSGSMALPTASKEGNKLRFVLPAINSFLQASNEENEYSILNFNNEARLLLDWTKDRNAILESLAKLSVQPAKGPTAFYDACRQGMDLTRRGSHRRKIIVLLSDGSDNASKDPRFGKLKQEVRASDVVFYTVNIVSLGMGFSDAAGQDATENLAKLTGGQAFFPLIRPFDIEATFELLALILRTQYLVGFRNFQTADDKWHEVKIEIKLPPTAPSELKYPVVKYRAGYFDRAARN